MLPRLGRLQRKHSNRSDDPVWAIGEMKRARARFSSNRQGPHDRRGVTRHNQREIERFTFLVEEQSYGRSHFHPLGRAISPPLRNKAGNYRKELTGRWVPPHHIIESQNWVDAVEKLRG